MRVIKGMALGTYYAKGAAAAKDTPNSSPMRGLIYAIKDNRNPPIAPQPIEHPRHPAKHAVFVDRTNAVEYVTLIAGQHRRKIADFFGATPSEITLVPVPSSEVTKATIDTARFPTLRLARGLAGVGLGTVRVLAVQARPVAAKTTGNRRTPDEILEGLVRTTDAIARRGVLVLVDDNIQSGASLAAVDKLLGYAGTVSAFAVGITDSRPRADAYLPRSFEIGYDRGTSSMTVTLSKR